MHLRLRLRARVTVFGGAAARLVLRAIAAHEAWC